MNNKPPPVIATKENLISILLFVAALPCIAFCFLACYVVIDSGLSVAEKSDPESAQAAFILFCICSLPASIFLLGSLHASVDKKRWMFRLFYTALAIPLLAWTAYFAIKRQGAVIKSPLQGSFF